MPTASTKAPHVLVIDDAPVNRRLFKARLESRGFDVTTAENGEAGFAACLEARVDVALVNAGIGAAEGKEICRRLKGDDRTSAIPLVLIVSGADAVDETSDFDAADDVLAAPAADLPLFTALNGLLDLRHARERAGRHDLGAEFEQALRRSRVAVLAQSPRVALTLRRALRSAVFVEVYTSPKKVLEDASEGRLDALVVDFVGEDVDGLGLLEDLRAARKAHGPASPVVMAAASPFDPEKTAAALRLGADDYCLRPIDPSHLRTRLRRHLMRRWFETAARETGLPAASRGVRGAAA